VKLAAAAGVTGTGPEAAAPALRKLPLTALAGQGGGVTAPGRPFPVMDGKLYVETVAAGFAAGHEAKVPLIIGGNSNEASLTRPSAATLDALPAAQRDAILKVFDTAGTGDKATAINNAVTVQTITEPDRMIARAHAKNGNPTWLYYFSYVPAAEKARKPYGAGHVDEVRFVFGQPRDKFAPEDLPLSNAMNAYWTAFAKTGDPGATWPKFTPRPRPRSSSAPTARRPASISSRPGATSSRPTSRRARRASSPGLLRGLLGRGAGA
jgi:para-nitrobenzyl esterase